MQWITRRRALIFGVIVILLGGFFWFRSRSNKQEPAQTYTVARQDIKEVVIASGEIEADKVATLKYPAVGKLAYINVSEGQQVKRGQSLAGMDTADLSAAETAAFYKYEAADANAKEIEDSVKGHDADETFAQKNDRVAAQTARDTAYDNWLAARRDTRDANLFSPLAGVVTNVTVSAVGASVGITDGVTVVDPASLYFALDVDEADVGKVELGQAVEVTLDAYPDQTLTGKVGSIAFASSLSDSGATVYKVRAVFSDQDLTKLRLGMNGDSRIVLNTSENALALPLEAVVDGEVTLPSGEKKQVETGLEGEQDIEIKSGLNEGDQVVVF